jgi:hypothetical protein
MADETLSINFDDLTIGDLEVLEDVAGPTAMKELQSGEYSAKLLKAFVLIAKRKSDPSFTAEQASQIKLSVLNKINIEAPPPNDSAVSA